MSLAKRILKRFKREHRPKDHIEIVDRAPTEEEGRRRADKAKSLVGTPFKRLPGNPPQDRVLLTTRDGTHITTAAVEMVYNDAWLIDEVNGPGSYESHASQREREVLAYARRAYNGGQE